ncbi:MAG: GNAT family N-acetyltransferase [Burkholderiales bacterium]|nr:GNAT family N-acetyltransferase [Phycisphaerae bacterium]
MSSIIATNLPVPSPREPISIRPATMDDLPFIDQLQKKHTKQVGWMPTKQLEGKIAAGHVLIAEMNWPQSHGGTENNEESERACEETHLNNSSSVSLCLRGQPLGYVIGNDQYFKRDDVGIIYQMNVLPGKQRGFIGATLLKAMFDRAAYGCRLFCCWCAQDIEANKFWEAMGFVPLAFRTGSRQKGPKGTARVHIFWQKRIRAGDTTTPWWFPSQTSSGAIREDRLVLPIPPATHWSEAKPIVLPGEVESEKRLDFGERSRAATSETAAAHRSSVSTKATRRSKVPTRPNEAAVEDQSLIANNGLRFAPAPVAVALPTDIGKRAPDAVARSNTPLERRAKQKNDPKFVAAARELRDRYLEQVNDGGHELPSAGKYDLTRKVVADGRSATRLELAA